MVSGSLAMMGTGVLPKGSLIVYLRFVFGTEVTGVCCPHHARVTGFDHPTES